MKPLVHALLSALRIDAAKRAVDYYAALGPVFEAAADGRGLLNLGLFERDDLSLAEAQEALVFKVTDHLNPEGRWLDVGCGPGGVGELLLTRHPRLQLMGLNVHPAQVEAARSRLAPFGSRAELRLGDADALPFPYASFDATFAIDAAFHFRDRDQFAHQASLVTRPGGGFAATDLVWRGRTHGRGNRLRGALARVALGAHEMLTPSDWRRIMERRGFDAVELIDLTGPVWAGLPRWAAQLRQDGPRLGLPAPLVQATCLTLERLHAQGDDADLGYVLVRGRAPARTP